MYELAPSILSADFARLGEEIGAVEEAGVHRLHIDVMDGMFVPSISFGFPVIRSIRRISSSVFDVHLMIEKPERYIEEAVDSGADIVTVHAEACTHLDRVIAQVRQTGKRVGVALNPATPLQAVEYVLEQVDLVLIMSVNPGFGNQKYLPYCTRKIRTLREWIRARSLSADIEVDGGINFDTIGEAMEAGANILVAGSAVFGEQTAQRAAQYYRLIREYEERL